MDSKINSVVIIGGGTAGWMTAASLSKLLKGKGISISLIESAEIGTIGVGEATLPGIREFNQYLGLDEVEFIKATNATFKLGIEFEDWHQCGKRFFHPFSGYGAPLNGVDFYHHWNRARLSGLSIPLESFCLSTQLAIHNKFAQPNFNNGNPLSEFNYAFHFDAIAYARFLRSYAERGGVNRIEQRVTGININPVSGYIESVDLQNGRNIEGQLFIDCSGFKGLLIKQAMQIGFEDWRHWLPCDSAIAVPCKAASEPTPYTKSIAQQAGWRWRIPLQHRTGNGMVFCRDYLSEDEATSQLLAQLDGEPLAEPSVIRFTTGKRHKIWHKNCVAIGLSSGFMEPLESTSIGMIQNGISQVHKFFPFNGFSEVEIAEVNRLNDLQYERIRDFLILHYQATARADTPFWQQCQRIALPESLQHKIELFKQRGYFARYDGEVFERNSWLSIFTGMGILPSHAEQTAVAQNSEAIDQKLHQIEQAVQQGVSFAGCHGEFIRKHCQAPTF